MYAYIKGTLQISGSDHMVVENNGMGFRVFTAYSTLQRLPQTGEQVKVFTHTYVREDILALYGFLTQEELYMFEMLLGVSGVGPKAALSVLSTVSPSKFALSVIMGDVKTLTKAQGVGNKLAQRIILELKDKIKKEQVNETEMPAFSEEYHADAHIAEAISALIVLGYSPMEARSAVGKAVGDSKDVESIIKQALRGMAR